MARTNRTGELADEYWEENAENGTVTLTEGEFHELLGDVAEASAEDTLARENVTVTSTGGLLWWRE